MTEEEFSKAAKNAGWDDAWIKEIIAEAKLDADVERSQKQNLIALPIEINLAMTYEFIVRGFSRVEEIIKTA